MAACGAAGGAASGAGAVLLEARPFRPFKSSEEYLYAMKEDLAEWLTVLYPELRITADNFLDRLDTGVALCRHANAVRESARQLLERAEGADEEALVLSRALRTRAPVSLLPAARPGTFFARDNLSNFIEWCRRALGVLECLLFETDDLCLRKNEKHVVLCLLEVARRGAVLGMPAPLLVQMERQIERELAGEEAPPSDAALGLVATGPLAQVVTNDLRSLDERVRDLVARCACPTQFPMVRVSEGKYRVGDTRLLIFVRILRSHVMVRVGGGWDTLAHYLDKHDPCRCRAAHRPTLAARLARPQPARPYADLSGATVVYERPEPASLPSLRQHASRAESPRPGGGAEQPVSLPPAHAPTSLPYLGDLSEARRRSVSPERGARPGKVPVSVHLSPSRSASNRSASPAARASASPERRARGVVSSAHLVPAPHAPRAASPRAAPAAPAPPSAARAASPPAAAESASDNGSEVSDEGYRSLGVVASPSAAAPARHSLHSHHSADDADYSERLDNDDGSEECVSLSTGLRRTGYAGTFYGGAGTGGGGGGGAARSARASPERVSSESNHSPSKSLRAATPATRIPHAPAARARSGTPASPPRAPAGGGKSTPRPPPAARNTWNGRAAPGQARARARPALAQDTFAPRAGDAFKRNSPLRASSSSLRSPPSASKPLSPLLEQILRSAEDARDDAGVLETMKRIIRQYSGGGGGGGGEAEEAAGAEAEYADFTSAWVMSDGRLERSASTRQLAAPRRDPRPAPGPLASRIPAPRRAAASTAAHAH